MSLTPFHILNSIEGEIRYRLNFPSPCSFSIEMCSNFPPAFECYEHRNATNKQCEKPAQRNETPFDNSNITHYEILHGLFYS